MTAAAGGDEATELTGRIEARLRGLDQQDVGGHPAAYEAMDADLRFALGALERS